MLGRFGGFVLVLVLLVGASVSVHADTVQSATDNAVQARVNEANTYLSAEVTRQIKAGSQDIITAVNANNDDNFRAFDQRMQNLMQDTRLQVIFGGIGAILVANALVGIIMAYTNRRYSLEYYQLQIIGKQAAEIDHLRQQQEVQGVAQMQQPAWQYQDPGRTMGTEFGQAVVGDLTQMNAWQMQQDQGAWRAPVIEQQPFQPPQQQDQNQGNNQGNGGA